MTDLKKSGIGLQKQRTKKTYGRINSKLEIVDYRTFIEKVGDTPSSIGFYRKLEEK